MSLLLPELPELPELPGLETAPAAGPWTEPVTLELRPRTKPMSLNDVLGGTTVGANRQRSTHVKDWRSAAYLAATRAGVPALVAGAPAHVKLICSFPVNRRRDEMSWTVPLKAVVDGLVEAGCWTDDTAETLVTWTVTWVKSPGPHRVVIAPADRFRCVHDLPD